MSMNPRTRNDLGSLQNRSKLLQRQETDIAKYFNCSTFIPDAVQTVKVSDRSGDLHIVSKNDDTNLDKYFKSISAAFEIEQNNDEQTSNLSHKVGTSSSKNYLKIPPSNKENLSDSRISARSLLSFRSNRTNTKNKTMDISSNVTGYKILTAQILSEIGSQQKLQLSSWGLPPIILEKYEARGIKTMFPWQVECLSNRRIMQENRNLIYSAPTSAGKTLVAEFLVLKTVLERRKKALFILPFVSVVREKMFYFQDLLSDSGVRVEGFMGGIAPPGGFAAVHIAIATIEKANSLINRLMEEGNLETLGAVVIDELHLLGDPNRGYLLELLLTKLRYMTLSAEHIDIQLIGMSATLPNLELLAKWLDAELYKTEFRPIPLNEQCKVGLTIFNQEMEKVRDIPPAPDLPQDTDNIIQLCLETIEGGHSILMFCPTKNWCEKLAFQIASTFLKLGKENCTKFGEIIRQHIDLTAIAETLEQLKRCPIGLDSVLKSTISFGVAFHHAGLTMDERDIIEGAFRVGNLKVLLATSTLSSGVNLPARRVIIRSPVFNGRPLDTLTYRQMIGRAGRMGKDTAGESILICKPNESSIANTLLSSTLEPIESCLEGSGPLIRALLEAIASQVVCTPENLDFYTKCTFVYACGDEKVQKSIEEAVQFLVENEFLTLKGSVEQDQRWVATSLGKACLAASIPPRDGLYLFEELQRARKCFVLDTELHIIYLVTPFNAGSQIGQIDWLLFLESWKSLSESERRVAQLVGVEERFLLNAMRGVVKPGKSLSIHRRFFTAMALHDLVREVPLNAVCHKYGCCRGVLQSLQQSSSTFSGMVTQFCKQLKWDCMELIFAQFQVRLQFGVCRDLLDLLRLPCLNGIRARSFYREGITTVAELAVAHEFDVEEALIKALPFESEKEYDGEHKTDFEKRNKMRTIFITGKDGLTIHEAALLLIRDARTLVMNELGVQGVQWNNGNKSKVSQMTDATTINETARDNDPKESLMLSKTSSSLSLTNRSPRLLERIQLPEIIPEETEESEKLNKSIKPIITEEVDNDITMFSESDIVSEKNDSKNINEVMEPITKADVVDNDSDITMFSEESDLLNSPVITNNYNKPTILYEKEQAIPEFEAKKVPISTTLDEINKTRSSPFESFPISPGAIDEIMNGIAKPPVSECLNIDANLKPSTIVPELSAKDTAIYQDCNSLLKENKSLSDEANNSRQSYVKSPSLFNDSSFLDSQICSILEKNIIDTQCFTEFEKSNISPFNNATTNNCNYKKTISIGTWTDISSASDTSKNSSKSKSTASTSKSIDNPDKSNAIKQSVNDDLIWKEDSWDVTNVKLGTKSKENKEKPNVEWDSPSLISRVRPTILTRPLIKTQNISSVKNTSSVEKISQKTKTNKPQMNTPKRILQKHIFEKDDTHRSPIACVTTYTNTRKLSLTSNKSDSDESIVSSQTVNSRNGTNSMRSRLEARIQTQKLKSRKLGGQGTLPTKSVKLDSESAILSKQNCITTIHNKSSSAESIILNSDEELPKKRRKLTQKSKSASHLNIVNDVKLENRTIYANDLNFKPDKMKLSSLEFVNISNSKQSFRLFKEFIIKRQEIALAMVYEPHKQYEPTIGIRIIGGINIDEKKKREKKTESYIYEDKKFCGVIISWGIDAIYYMPFSNSSETKVTIKERINLLKEMLSSRTMSVRCSNVKETYKILYQCCGISPLCKFIDPTVGDWLMNSEVCDKSFVTLAIEYFPVGHDIARNFNNHYERNIISSETRASAEAVLAWYTTDAIVKKLKDRSDILLLTFKEVEMETVLTLARMELRGFGINFTALQELSTVLKKDLLLLEERAYGLAGRKFNFCSPREVAKVLGLVKSGKGLTNKTALKNCENPLSNIIISWRKLNTVHIKTVLPLLNLSEKCARLHGNCITRTVTGRISMHEPNLQSIPRDFTSEASNSVFSVRMAFIPNSGNVILTADYCQLELRILAHFSKDPTLTQVMLKEGDIFKNISAKLNKVPEYMVTDEMRQRTKQLCYGMIYGMGTRTLAETLSVTESEARDFLENFMGTYKGIRVWLNSVSEKARIDGYVKTITDRCRMLPGLKSEHLSEKAQAERQAVNTKIQGSAADITKKAMVMIENRMQQQFDTQPWVLPASQSKRKLRSSDSGLKPRGGYLTLQLHDELLYEVNSNDLKEVAIIVKESMEQAFTLNVPLPVKVKVGSAWGEMSEYEVTND